MNAAMKVMENPRSRLVGTGYLEMKKKEELLKDLLSDDDLVSSPAAHKLGRIGDRGVIPDLWAVYESSESKRLKESIVISLGMLGGRKAVMRLESVLGSQDRRLRIVAIRSLARIGGPDVIPILLSTLKHPDSQTRGQAAEDLGSFDDQQVKQGLLDALRDEKDASVRGRIIGTLGEIGDKDLIPVFIEYLDDEQFNVRVVAARVLARLRAISAVPKLIELVNKDPSDWVQENAIQALEELGTEEALEAVEKWERKRKQE